MKKKKKIDKYAPQITGGGYLRERVSEISRRTGKKMYQVVKEVMEIGLEQLESSIIDNSPKEQNQ